MNQRTHRVWKSWPRISRNQLTKNPKWSRTRPTPDLRFQPRTILSSLRGYSASGIEVMDARRARSARP